MRRFSGKVCNVITGYCNAAGRGCVMTTFRVHLIYKDVFVEECDTLEEAIQRVRKCFGNAHDPLLLGEEPEIFGYELGGA